LLSVVAFGIVPGAPIIGVPIALLILGAGWVLRSTRNRRKVGGVREMREKAQTADQGSDEIEFTDRDKQSLYTP
jgi:hypothetical protein